MEFDSNWQEHYARMVSPAKKALKQVRSGQRVFIGTGCGEPTELVKALTERAGELSDVEIVQLFTKGDASYAQRKYADCFRLNSFFIGQNVRDMIQEGLGSYTPILLSNIPHLFNTGLLPIDVALIQTTPPNKHGKVSLGISVDIVKSAVENASLIIAQVNPQMPWTLGDSVIDIYDIDILVPADVPLIERMDEPIHEVSRMIGRNIATLVPDGATIQFGLGRMQGLGRIPHATIEFLKDKKDLGIHSEMITDSILGLIRSGVVNGSRKSSDRGRIVTSFCMGTKELYDAVNDNPLFCFRPTEYVNDFQGDQPAEQDGGDQHGPGDRSHRPDLLGFPGRHALFRHRRSRRLQPRGHRLQGGQEHRRPALDQPGRNPLQHHDPAQPRLRGIDHPRRRLLRRHRIRGRLPLRQERPGSGHGPDRHRPPEFPRTAVP